jgi:N6-adenosine-specific RNA methylase IME4
MNNVVPRFKTGKGKALTKFHPKATRVKLGGIKAMIVHARRLEDWRPFEKAVRAYAAEQAAFVAWWDAHVSPGHGQGKGQPKATFSAADVEAQTGISKQQVSRWRACVSDLDGYVEALCKSLWKVAWANRTREDMHAEDEARVRGLRRKPGKFLTLVADPPWDYEWLSVAGRAKPGYATMTHDELLDLDVAQWAEDNCHLYLWTTNNFMTRAVELMRVWGFEHKTVLTWVKPRWGLGSYFRNQTEHVLFGVRGELRTRADNISTIIEAPVGEHSVKPDEFYDIVSRASHLPAGELFQRTPRKGFTNVFEKADA